MQRTLKTVYDANGAPKQIAVMQDIFTYTVGFTGAQTLAPSAVITDAISFETDSDFIWTKTTYNVYSAAPAGLTENTLVVPAITVSINDSGSGRNLQQKAVPISCMAGRGQLPFILPRARTFKGNSTVQFAFTNFSTTDTYQYLTLQLHGYKEWR